MRIKRYEAPTIQEALMKVKKDLGPEAVILYTKTFRKGGVLGLFGKLVAEITAGAGERRAGGGAFRGCALIFLFFTQELLSPYSHTYGHTIIALRLSPSYPHLYLFSKISKWYIIPIKWEEMVRK